MHHRDPHLLLLRHPPFLAWKQQNTEWGQYGVTLPLLGETKIDQISVECAASGSPELVAVRIEKALAYVSPEHLFPCTDCGMVPRTRAAARGRGTARANRRGRHDLDGRLAQALLVVAWLGDGIRGAR